MTRMRLPIFLHLLLLAGTATPAACTKNAANTPPSPQFFTIDAVHLQIPRLEGWEEDTSLPASPSGGTVLRLVRHSAVVGSPRLEVVLTDAAERPTVVEDFLTRNLRELGALESSGQIHITGVEQRRVALGAAKAYRVHHAYTMGSGGAQASIDQVSTFLVLGGRGVAITAAGRTELFHPQAEAIERMMTGLRLGGSGDAPGGAGQPTNLGKLGGQGAPP